MGHALVWLCLAFYSDGDLQRALNTDFDHRWHPRAVKIVAMPDNNLHLWIRIPENELPRDPNGELAIPGVDFCPGTSF